MSLSVTELNVPLPVLPAASPSVTSVSPDTGLWLASSALKVSVVVPPFAILLPSADEMLDDARAAASSYGVRTIDRVVRARSAGRAIVEEAARRHAEIVVLGAPRARRRDIFGKTVDYVLKNASCRVMIAAGRRAA